MIVMHPRSMAQRAGLSAVLLLGGCSKNDGDTSSGGASESSGGTSATTTAAPTTGDTGGPSSSGDPSAASSTSMTGETSSTAATSTTGDDTGAAVDCDSYCDLVMLNCAGDFSQYGSPETCKTSCAAFAPGSPGDMSGNSLACRHYHAGLAAMANDVHCGHAGPGGDMACGSNCEGFCAIAGQYCPDAWPDNDACIAACSGFATDEVYDANDVAGDTFACRLYHATAASLDPATHCGHITGDSPTCK